MIYDLAVAWHSQYCGTKRFHWSKSYAATRVSYTIRMLIVLCVSVFKGQGILFCNGSYCFFCLLAKWNEYCVRVSESVGVLSIISRN